MAYYIDMIKANIAELKNHLSEFICEVENGNEIQVCRRNIPVAEIKPIKQSNQNCTTLGSGKDTVKIKGDLTEPFIPEDSWLMLQKNQETQTK
ncbi:MAG: hypothetical protein CMB97_00370 [Flavobacteriaceae bacterium]|nr:hypothetical protein [Flavobacteriaceae bacterium]